MHWSAARRGEEIAICRREIRFPGQHLTNLKRVRYSRFVGLWVAVRRADSFISGLDRSKRGRAAMKSFPRQVGHGHALRQDRQRGGQVGRQAKGPLRGQGS